MTITAPELRAATDDELLAGFSEADESDQRRILAEADRRDHNDKQNRKNRATAAEWVDGAHAQMIEAEAVCNGVLVRADSPVQDAWSLWSGNEAYAMAHASEELRNFWQDFPRITVSTYRKQISDGRRQQRNERDAATQTITPEGKTMTTKTKAAHKRAARRQAPAVTYTKPGEVFLPARRQSAHIRDTMLGDAFDVLSCYSGATEHQIMLEVTFGAMTNVYQYFPAVPRLAILANSPSSGKTVNGQLTLALCHAPEIMGAYWTVASLYGTLETERGACLFLDEMDKLLGEDGLRTGEKANACRAILNDGYQPEGIVRKVVGRKVIKIPTYGPAITSGLGTLPADTLERCLVLHLAKNKPSSVYVAPRHKQGLVEIGARIASVLAQPEAAAFMMQAALSDAEGVGDDGRFCLIMTPMAAVADYFGYGRMFRAGIREVQDKLIVDPPRPMHEWLLRDLRECWPADQPQLAAEDVIRLLHTHPEHRWNRVLTLDQAGLLMLGRYLGKLDIESKPRGGRGQANVRVYLRADVAEREV